MKPSHVAGIPALPEVHDRFCGNLLIIILFISLFFLLCDGGVEVMVATCNLYFKSTTVMKEVTHLSLTCLQQDISDVRTQETKVCVSGRRSPTHMQT